MQKLFLLMIAACFAGAVYSSYRAIDSVAGIFDGRGDVQITQIETTGRVEVARINADRDIQVTTINAQRDVTTHCINADYNAFRCIEAGGVPGTRRPSLSAGQLWLLGLASVLGLIGLAAMFRGGANVN